MNTEILARADKYISDLLAPEDDVLVHVLQSLEKAGIENAGISPVQGKLLQVLAGACQARRILELGTLGAYSTIWLARALRTGGKLITIEYDPVHAAIAQDNIHYAGLADIVELHQGPALDILSRLAKEEQEPFDLIFIDADKPPYLEYFQYALKLSRPGSIIICDNVIRNGEVLNENSTDEKVRGVQRLNHFLSTCNDVTATVLQVVGSKPYDGMVIAVVN